MRGVRVSQYLRAGSLRQIPHFRVLATSAAETSAPSSSSLPPPTVTNDDPTLNRIVDDISGLTLLQAADLVALLKSRLNIQELAMPTGLVAPATSATPVEETAPVEEAKPKEKTIFNVTLEKFDAAAKPKIIKEIKNLIPNMNLMEAKKFVESAPKVLKENVPKEDADKLQKTLEALGATVTLS